MKKVINYANVARINSPSVFALLLHTDGQTDEIDEYQFSDMSEARQWFELLFVTGDKYSIRQLVNPYYSDDNIIVCARDIVKKVTTNMIDNQRVSATYQNFVNGLYADVRTGRENPDVDDMLSEAAIAICQGMRDGLSVWAIYRAGYSAVNTWLTRQGRRGAAAGREVSLDALVECLTAVDADGKARNCQTFHEYFDRLTLEEDSDFAALVSAVDASLLTVKSELQRDAIIAVADGHSVRDIAAYRGKAPSTIQKQIQSARVHIATDLLNHHTDVLPVNIVMERESILTLIKFKAFGLNN